MEPIIKATERMRAVTVNSVVTGNSVGSRESAQALENTEEILTQIEDMTT